MHSFYYVFCICGTVQWYDVIKRNIKPHFSLKTFLSILFNCVYEDDG